MNNLSKRKAMQKWLESNPGKTERDWLLEERCESEEQRQLISNILSLCKKQDVRIAPIISLKGDFSKQFVKNGYHSKYFNLLEPFSLRNFSRGAIISYMRRNGASELYGADTIYTPTTIQFDFSLFGKYYFNLGETIEKQSTPSDQWRKYLIEKLADIPAQDAEDIASLIIKSNYDLMGNTPLYDLESPEFWKVLEDKIEQKRIIREKGLDKIPPNNFQPYNAKVPYPIPNGIHHLTLSEFIKKITQPNICKGGRLIISFVDVKSLSLMFPDEAAGIVNKYGEIYSGYYDEIGVVYPEIIDFGRILNSYDLSQFVMVRTKRHGTIPVLDIVPFEYGGYAFTAIVVDLVNVNGMLSKVSEWL